MARLTLDENGTKRRFKLNPGKLTIGSGEGATLRLTSANVAELHAELVFEGGVARLRPRPGVLPPSLGGKDVSDETPLADGQVVRIGGAAISVEYDEGEGPRVAAAPARNAAPRPAPARAGRPAAGAKQAASPAPAAAAGTRQAVSRQRREAKKGLPTWAILLIVAAVIGVGYVVVPPMLEKATSADFSALGAKNRFDDFWKDGDSKGAAKVLEEFEANAASLTPEWRRQYEDMKALVQSSRAQSAQGAIDQEATREWQNQLSNYADKYLAGAATRPKARVFVKRLLSFRERYPDHEQREWVDRMLTRYTSLAELNDPATLADLQWEVTTLTAAKPRRYREAFQAIDAFLGHASGGDRDEGLKLKATLESEQKTFFDEEVLGAAIYYDKVKYPTKFDAMKSVEILVQLVIGMADPELADEAARMLVQMPESTVLQGYQRDRRQAFDALMENAIVRKRAQELGLLQ